MTLDKKIEHCDASLLALRRVFFPPGMCLSYICLWIFIKGDFAKQMMSGVCGIEISGVKELKRVQ